MKVYSSLELATRAIPKLDSFKIVIEQAQDCLQADPAIVAAMTLGSIAYDQHSPTSDIDILCILAPGHLSAQPPSLAHLVGCAHSLHVPLGLILLDQANAQAGLHRIMPAFHQHLEIVGQRHGFLKGNPLEHICKLPSTIEVDIQTYMVRKIEKLTKILAELKYLSHESQCRDLSDVLSTPLHIARKTLQLYQGEDYQGNTDDRYTVLKTYRNHPKIPAQLRDIQLESILLYHDEYRKLLARHSPPNVTLEQYYTQEITRLLTMVTPSAIDFIQSNLQLLHDQKLVRSI